MSVQFSERYLSQHQFYSNNNAHHKLVFLSHLLARCCGQSNETYRSVSVINKDWNGAKGIRCARIAELTPKPSHFSVSPPKLYPQWGDLEIVKESNGPKDLRDGNKGFESISSALIEISAISPYLQWDHPEYHP
jgi:hypothetical protein